MAQETVDNALVMRGEGDQDCARIRRSVFMEDKVWAVSEAGLTAAAIESPAEELAAVPFVGVGACDWE
jgi:hypothetical protein